MKKVAWILVVIGAINWGLVGVGEFFGSNWNVVNLVAGSISWLEAVIYILVGLSGIMLIFGHHHKGAMSNDAMPMNGNGGNM